MDCTVCTEYQCLYKGVLYLYLFTIPYVETTSVHLSVRDLVSAVNPLNAELNPTCCLLALLGVHHFLHVSRIRVKSLTLRLLMLYVYIWSTHS